MIELSLNAYDEDLGLIFFLQSLKVLERADHSPLSESFRTNGRLKHYRHTSVIGVLMRSKRKSLNLIRLIN